MASKQDSFPKYPREVRGRTQPPVTVYTRLRNHYAVHRQGVDSPSSKEAVATLNEGGHTIDVFEGEVVERKSAGSPGEVSPVYALQPDGTPAVPTGQVFIRFNESVPAEQHLREIQQAGYEIAQSLEYAPHAAWLRPRSGKIADALSGVPALEKIPDVDNVEPQMLMPRFNR